MSSDARTLAIVALIAFAPGAVVLIVAMLRGYSIHLLMHRERRHRDDQ